MEDLEGEDEEYKTIDQKTQNNNEIGTVMDMQEDMDMEMGMLERPGLNKLSYAGIVWNSLFDEAGQIVAQARERPITKSHCFQGRSKRF